MEQTDTFVLLPFEKILLPENRLRLHLNEEHLQRLADTIKQRGTLQPILIRPLPDGNYRIIAGERRYLATKMAGFTTIPCIIKDVDDSEVYIVSLMENLLRKDLSDYEIALALKHALDKFPDTYPTYQKLGETFGRSKSWVSNHLRILDVDLPPEILAKITERQIRVILSARPEKQQKILQKIKETMEIPSSRDIEKMIEEEDESITVQPSQSLFVAQKPWFHSAQRYIPSNVIKSVSENFNQSNTNYKLRVLKTVIECAWDRIEKNGQTEAVMRSARNPLTCTRCNANFFGIEDFNNHKCMI